jgi:hypothetical protein
MAATGSVYIFNTTNQAVKVELNDTDLDDRIPARRGKKEEPEPAYVPAQVKVPRNDATQTPDAVFTTNNKLEIKFSGVSHVYPTVKIDPGSYSTDTDLVLYIFFNGIVLVSTINNAIIYSGMPTP